MRLLSIISTLFLFHSGSMAFPGFKDIIIDTVPSGSELGNGHDRFIAEHGDLSVILYTAGNYSNNAWARFENHTTGSISQIPIANKAQMGIAGPILVDRQELVISYVQNKPRCVVVEAYRLQGADVPDSTSFISRHEFGDSDSRNHHILKLSSGALVIMWYQFTALPDYSMDVGFVYRSPDKVWSPEFTVNLEGDGVITSSSLAIVQHPADKSIWAFIHRDSFKSISAFHFIEEADSLRLDWVKNKFVNQITHGLDGPDGENPYLLAVPAPARNSIMLGYQSDERKWFANDYPNVVIGSYVTIMEIKNEADYSFIKFSTWVERVTKFGLTAIGQSVYLTSRPINEGVEFEHPEKPNRELYVNQYDFTSAEWSQPVHLGRIWRDWRTGTRSTPIPTSTSRLVFVSKMDDDFIHIFDFTKDSVTNVRGELTPKEPLFFLFSNPTNSSVDFTYRLPSAQPVQLSIYTTGGKLIETVVNDVRSPGTHRSDWNYGPGASGVYLLNMRMGDEETVQKILLSR